jgi:hypothetical protein
MLKEHENFIPSFSERKTRDGIRKNVSRALATRKDMKISH